MMRRERDEDQSQSHSEHEEDHINLESSEESVPSTSSDEDFSLSRKTKGRRERKNYQPEEDENTDDESSLEGTFDILEDEEEAEILAPAKRRKKEAQAPEGCTSLDAVEEHDKEEAALQQALAMSVQEGTGAAGTSKDAGRIGQPGQDAFDAEEAALQQALAASLADSIPSTGAPHRKDDEHAASGSNAKPESKCATPKVNEEPEAATPRGGSSKGIRPTGKKGGKKAPKPAFPAPSRTMVQQGFQLLDPTNSGFVNPYALSDVAGKLLHKELDRAQIAAMMEFAANVTIQSEGGQHELADEHLINEEAFIRLVARFAARPEEGE